MQFGVRLSLQSQITLMALIPLLISFAFSFMRLSLPGIDSMLTTHTIQFITYTCVVFVIKRVYAETVIINYLKYCTRDKVTGCVDVDLSCYKTLRGVVETKKYLNYIEISEVINPFLYTRYDDDANHYFIQGEAYKFRKERQKDVIPYRSWL